MNKFLTPRVLIAATIFVFTTGCDPTTAPLTDAVPEMRPNFQANFSDFTARGKPIVISEEIDFMGTIPAGNFCPDVPVDAHASGRFVSQIWTTGEPFVDETLAKNNIDVYNTFTHPVTGKSITSHQTTASQLVIAGGKFLDQRSSGAFTRVVTRGEGLVEYFIGHLTATVDFSTTPPEFTFAFHGRDSGTDLCDLIDE